VGSIHFKAYTYYILPLAEDESKAESSVKLCVLTKLNYCLNCHLMYKIFPVAENFITLIWLIHFEDLIAFVS